MIEYSFRFRVPLRVLATIQATDAASALEELESRLRIAFLTEAIPNSQLFMSPLKEIECYCIDLARKINMDLEERNNDAG